MLYMLATQQHTGVLQDPEQLLYRWQNVRLQESKATLQSPVDKPRGNLLVIRLINAE